MEAKKPTNAEGSKLEIHVNLEKVRETNAITIIRTSKCTDDQLEN